jgi:DNA-directed RNA polymerase subunit M/transcription elongation factor TFIIS
MEIDDKLEKLIPLHPQRKKIYEKFFTFIKKHANDIQDKDILKMALNLERGIFNYAISQYKSNTINESWNYRFKNLYIDRAVIIYNNLNPDSKIKNPNLLKRYLSKEFNEFELCFFTSEELFPEKWKENVEKYMKDTKEFATQKIEDRADGILKCGKCKSYKTEYNERQTRSADEPTTKFCYCHNCGNRWRFC